MISISTYCRKEWPQTGFNYTHTTEIMVVLIAEKKERIKLAKLKTKIDCGNFLLNEKEFFYYNQLFF